MLSVYFFRNDPPTDTAPNNRLFATVVPVYPTEHLAAVAADNHLGEAVVAIFLTDDSIRKVIYMSAAEISKKCTMLLRDWGLAFPQFAILFEDRFTA